MPPQGQRSAPAWRREPYRLLFPLGAALGVGAVLPFPLRGAGGGALGLFHSVAQILGFVTCFVMGFLFTFLPRRTRTPAPDGWEVAVALVVPPWAAALAWTNAGALPYLLWLVLLGVALAFTVPRLRAAARAGELPAALVWVPVSLAAGVIGAGLSAWAPILSGGGAPPAWVVGRGLLVQGLVAGLVLGVASVLVPQLTRGEAIPVAAPLAQRRALTAHAIAAVAFFVSFPIEVLLHVQLGLALRAALATAALVAAAGLHRPPTLPGLHRWLIWVGAWLVPAGFWIAALFPRHRAAALHVLFVGGFAQLALAVSTHVVLSHADRPQQLSASPWPLRLMALLLAAAFAGRLVAGVDHRRAATWLALAGAAFIAAVLCWAVVVAPGLVARPAPPPPPPPDREK